MKLCPNLLGPSATLRLLGKFPRSSQCPDPPGTVSNPKVKRRSARVRPRRAAGRCAGKWHSARRAGPSPAGGGQIPSAKFSEGRDAVRPRRARGRYVESTQRFPLPGPSPAGGGQIVKSYDNWAQAMSVPGGRGLELPHGWAKRTYRLLCLQNVGRAKQAYARGPVPAGTRDLAAPSPWVTVRYSAELILFRSVA